MRTRKLCLWTGVILCLALSVVVQADDYHWKSPPASGNFLDEANWSDGMSGYPDDIGDNALIDVATDVDYTVTYDHDGTTSIGKLTLTPNGSGTVSLDVNDGTLLVDNSFTTRPGSVLNVNTGGMLDIRTDGYHDGNPDFRGTTLNINGGLFQERTNSATDFYFKDSATINITNGGEYRRYFGRRIRFGYTDSNDHVVMNIDGGTAYFRSVDAVRYVELGYRGTGEFNITNGGTLTVNSNYAGLCLGGNTTSYTNGVINLIDGTATNNGKLLINNNATHSNAEASVNVSGGVFTQVGETFVGNKKKGELNVTGGQFNAQSNVTAAPEDSSATGLVNVDGGLLTVHNDTTPAILTLGGATGGIGRLQLQSGQITVDSLIANQGSRSELSITGGTLKTKSTTVDTGSVLNIGDGVNIATLDLDGGTHSFADGLHVNIASMIKGNGTVQGNVTMDGALAAGNSPGSLIFTDDLTQSSSASAIFEFDGDASFDQITVNGDLEIAGTLALVFNYAPAVGMEFVIYDAGGTLTNNLTEIQWQGTAVDGEVNVVGNDLVVSIVPEPTTLALLAGGATLLLRRRRK